MFGDAGLGGVLEVGGFASAHPVVAACKIVGGYGNGRYFGWGGRWWWGARMLGFETSCECWETR